MKQYNGEKAIISLTSWKARINTVCKTLFSLIDQCPGFHIVLVLSEEEFPKKEDELPENLKIFVENELIEVLWVYKNYKSFKKVLFTMDKYRNVPVISADDDCIYKYNYAEELYKTWLLNKRAFVSYYQCDYKGFSITGGYATLYPPNVFPNAYTLISDEIIGNHEDDCMYAVLRQKLGCSEIVRLNKPFWDIAEIHDEQDPLHNLYRNSDAWKQHLMNIDGIICKGNN